MLKRMIIGAVALLMASFSFAAGNALPTTAANITVKAAKVKLATTSPMGKAEHTAKNDSTEVEMDITNNGMKQANLIAATSPMAQKVQLHHFVTKDGKSVMRQITSIQIKSHSEDDLSFQGVHIMLIGLKAPLAKGQQVPLTLIFGDGSHLSVKATVV